MTVAEPRVWQVPPQPDRDVTRVTDRHGRLWEREPSRIDPGRDQWWWLSSDGSGESNGRDWAGLVVRYGPVVEAP